MINPFKLFALPNWPKSATIDEWELIAMEFKLKYPFRFWLNDTLPWMFGRYISRPVKDVCYWLRTHIYNRYHILDIRDKKNGYAWGWIDTDNALLFACFALLVKYVEQEKPFEVLNWDWNEEQSQAGKEIRALYDWWKVRRPAKLKELETLMVSNYERYKIENDELDKVENDMLIRLIKVRRFLWT